MCDDAEEPSVLDTPPIFPLVVTWDEEGAVRVDLGTMNLYEAYGVLIAAAEAIKEEVPFVSVTGAWANVSDSDDEDDD